MKDTCTISYSLQVFEFFTINGYSLLLNNRDWGVGGT